MLAQDALIVIQDEYDLEQQLELLMNSPERREKLGAAGHEWLLESQGAVGRALKLIEDVAQLNQIASQKIETVHGDRR